MFAQKEIWSWKKKTESHECRSANDNGMAKTYIAYEEGLSGISIALQEIMVVHLIRVKSQEFIRQ